ncbi:ATP synthase subunit I [Mycolicibacterium palauense]|uniref:ATP synthase subunit I n=1 Tax=Mycolicibacterium palauense TaxID=2034511 RepID=UPI000BFEF671|nr:ATP synthase subunit I [Mycolicibacterium palauense]
MTTPAQDAPLVFPALAFRPVRLSIICAVLGAIAVVASSLLGAVMFGVFFVAGLATGLVNALLVRRAAARITAKEHPLKSQMALNSSIRIFIITVIALVVAWLFRPQGLGVVFGVAVFQMLLVASTSLPVLKALRRGARGGADGREGNQ